MIQFRGMHPELKPYAEYAVNIARYYGLNPQITSVYRGMAFQARLRANWEDCRARGLYPSDVSLAYGLSCKWPANRPGDSGHNYGLAWDSWVPQDQMADWTAIREYVGWRVPSNDAIHSELPDWRGVIA